MKRVFLIFLFSLLTYGICNQLFAEEIKLTTYYPSPNGVYKKLVAYEGLSFNGSFRGDKNAISIQKNTTDPLSLDFVAPGIYQFFASYLDNGNVSRIIRIYSTGKENSKLELYGGNNNGLQMSIGVKTNLTSREPNTYITSESNQGVYILGPSSGVENYIRITPQNASIVNNNTYGLILFANDDPANKIIMGFDLKNGAILKRENNQWRQADIEWIAGPVIPPGGK